MKIVFLGAEVGSHRTLLNAAGVEYMGVNFWRLRKRGLPKTKNWLISEKFPDGVEVYLSAGAHQAEKEFGDDHEAMNSYVDEYLQFIANNVDRIAGAEEFDSNVMGARWRENHRNEMMALLGEERFWVVWRSDQPGSIDSLAERYQHVAIPGTTIEAETTLSGRLRSLTSLYGTTWHAVAHARPDDLRSLPVASVHTLAWLAPMLRGETISWNGTKLDRYPSDMKDQARRRLAGVCARAGLDHQMVMNDDPNTLAMLALWSLKQLEGRINGNLSDNFSEGDSATNAESDLVVPNNKEPQVRNRNPVVKRDPAERMNLPIVSFDVRPTVERDADGNEFIRDAPVMKSTGVSLRQCDTCFVASNCPAYQPANECAFNLPVEVKTTEQLLALLNTVIEMQVSRVAFARYAEELAGGYPDPNTSQEMDRLFRLIKTKKELGDNRETLRLTVERQTSGGVLSAIFGDRAQVLKELPNGGINEERATRIIQDGLEN